MASHHSQTESALAQHQRFYHCHSPQAFKARAVNFFLETPAWEIHQGRSVTRLMSDEFLSGPSDFGAPAYHKRKSSIKWPAMEWMPLLTRVRRDLRSSERRIPEKATRGRFNDRFVFHPSHQRRARQVVIGVLRQVRRKNHSSFLLPSFCHILYS